MIQNGTENPTVTDIEQMQLALDDVRLAIEYRTMPVKNWV